MSTQNYPRSAALEQPVTMSVGPALAAMLLLLTTPLWPLGPFQSDLEIDLELTWVAGAVLFGAVLFAVGAARRPMTVGIALATVVGATATYLAPVTATMFAQYATAGADPLQAALWVTLLAFASLHVWFAVVLAIAFCAFVAWRRVRVAPDS